MSTFGNAACLAFLHHGFARGINTFGVGITFALRQHVNHVLNDFIGCCKAERRRIANIQFEDAVAFLLHAIGFLQRGSANVVTDII